MGSTPNIQTGNAVEVVSSLTRRTNTAVVLIHHHRKNQDGATVSAFRGGNAISGVVDILIGLKKRPGGGRTAQFDSRYDESPEALVVDIKDGVYVALGDERSVKHVELCDALEAALSTEPQPSKAFAEVVGQAGTSVRRALDDLVEQGKARRTGAGKRGDPYLFSSPEKDSTTLGMGAGGRNFEEGAA